jgi:hypothetical protein
VRLIANLPGLLVDQPIAPIASLQIAAQATMDLHSRLARTARKPRSNKHLHPPLQVVLSACPLLRLLRRPHCLGP